MKPAKTVSLQTYLEFVSKKTKQKGKTSKPRGVARVLEPREPFDYGVALAWMDEQLEKPLAPELEWIERIQPPGKLVVRFALPLELCQRTDAIRHMPPWRYGQIKNDLFTTMWVQMAEYRLTPYSPLPGRPAVRCVRFSRRETDPGAGWEKQALDELLPPRPRRKKGGGTHIVSGLGLIRDDRGSALQRFVWWEPAPKGVSGGVLLELWTGDTAP